MVVYLVTGIILLVYLVLVWFVGTWLHPPGAGIWILRGGLALIGLIASAAFLWFHHKSKEAEADGDQPVGQRGLFHIAHAVDVHGHKIVASEHLAGDLRVFGIDVIHHRRRRETRDVD